jgi:transcriptional regulator with XRE-family HTH domain
VDYTEARHYFGAKLRELRTEKNITQEQLAELINKSIEHISFLERGERSPSFELLIDIANACAISPADLLGFDFSDHAPTLTEVVGLDAISTPSPELIDNSLTPQSERESDMERLQAAVEGIRTMQRLADEYGIRDILQDNGGKVLQVLILLGLKISPGREGNDAVDVEGNEYELKTINRALNKNAGVTTHHHLNREILAKYRAVKAWFVAIYESIELVEIYRIEPSILEPVFQIWEQKLEIMDSINNPKIPMRYVRQGELVYPKKSD